MTFLEFPTLPSTSGYVADHAATLPDRTLVFTPAQTQGRGQRGNSWESEPGLNLTFTAIFRPIGWEARRQFLISEAVAVAIADTLTAECGVSCSVKWPNDIYAHTPGGGVGKICGILISHALEGTLIRHTLVGAGININQTRFLSDAPNPVSVRGITRRTFPLPPLLEAFARAIEEALDRLWNETDYAPRLHERYMALLWRGDGRLHPWIDAATGRHFTASIYAIEPLGHLVLRTPDGTLRRYAFKEVTPA